MGRTHLHTFELFSERITFFHHAIVSEVRAQYPQDPHFQSLPRDNQIIYLDMGRTSTHQYNFNAPKIVVLGPVDLEKVHQEL